MAQSTDERLTEKVIYLLLDVHQNVFHAELEKIVI